jgi:hypothetical protein
MAMALPGFGADTDPSVPPPLCDVDDDTKHANNNVDPLAGGNGNFADSPPLLPRPKLIAPPGVSPHSGRNRNNKNNKNKPKAQPGTRPKQGKQPGNADTGKGKGSLPGKGNLGGTMKGGKETLIILQGVMVWIMHK